MVRSKVFAIAVKIETTSGTDAVPDASTDAVRTVGVPTLNPGYLAENDRDDAQTGTLIAADRATPAGRFASIDISVEVRGFGAAYNTTTNKPEADALLRMAGLSRTVVVGTSILYSTLDDGMETGTVYCWTGGDLVKLVGCVATLKLAATANGRGILTFGVTGRIATDPATAAVPGGLAFSSVLPPIFNGATVTIGSYSSTAGSDPLMLRKADLDLGNVIADLASAGATDGHAGYVITDRKATQTLEISKPALASFDAFAMSKATGGSLPTTAWQIGTSAFNRLKVQTGRWSLKKPGAGDASGLVTQSLTGTLGAGAATTGREINLLFD